MTGLHGSREFGVERGKVFPASSARSLLNPLRRLVQSPKRLVASMNLHPDARVLELGCGPGYFSPLVAKALPSGSMVLFDLQVGMLEHARRRLADEPAAYTQGDAMALPFARDSFDAILLVTVLGEVPDMGACVDEVVRVLAPSGRATISETRRDADFIPLNTLRDVCEPRGLRLAELSGGRWQYTAHFEAKPGTPNPEEVTY